MSVITNIIGLINLLVGWGQDSDMTLKKAEKPKLPIDEEENEIQQQGNLKGEQIN
jgi:hypothetical protein